MFIQRILLLLVPVILLIGCASPNASNGNRVGLLLEDTIDDQGWNSKGYQGLLNIHSNLNVEVMFKEDMNTEPKVKNAIEDFVKEEVELVFGHGRYYADLFTEIAPLYPDVHFVSFNGEVEGDNVTSLHFDSYAMGYFAGMIAAAMSETGHIGAIATFPWQPEVQGFEAGAALYGRNDSSVHIEYVHDWFDSELASSYFEQLKSEGVDVFYPAGDGFHVSVIEEARNEGLYAIGYVGDQSDLGESTVLTSTVQHVDYLYELIAEKYFNSELEKGNLRFDFDDGVITLGNFSSKVPEEFQIKIGNAVKSYIETGELPQEPI
ncbi:BMP family ABC transporter substrate-binding protein [Halalkalibacter krulwichiae]|uniref:Purine-binding protein n=1 Tax=Halalkalibacter krulwichiae TaxID=199441 RepID=A0A1X9MDK9_9BACI|nr:BMP family ABC transporter substrate-binding protein [Halalkalibacter krulwichiae]ARK31496.1 Purine-binding protein precursor [Halalkalibacter krulwichiae]